MKRSMDERADCQDTVTAAAAPPPPIDTATPTSASSSSDQAAATTVVSNRIVVTTGNDRDMTATKRSQALAATLNGITTANSGVGAATNKNTLEAVWSSRYIQNATRPTTLNKLMAEHSASAVLVVDGSGTHLTLRDESGSSSSGQNSTRKKEFRLHGGLGVLRLRNVLGGGNDALTSVCELREGDVFVDATAGQLQDSLVAAAKVGASGKVIAIEASPLLWAVSAGRPVCTGDADVDAMLNERIEVRLGEACTVLRAMADDSCDVVYFDPMWQKPTKSSQSFEVLRTLAHSERLDAEAIAQARRVARRKVVVMDQRGGVELERLGLTRVVEGQKKCFGEIRIGAASAQASAPEVL